jgi:hypothetical protein
MRVKVAVIVILVLAVFPTLATGVAQETVHAALQALNSIVGGGPRG